MARKRKGWRGSRRKQFNRQQRLQSARRWLESYEGNKVVRDYRRRYGVPVDPDYRERVLQSVAAQAAARRRKRAAEQERAGIESDDHFAFIVGYTSSGAPYGLTWEEWEALEEE